MAKNKKQVAVREPKHTRVNETLITRVEKKILIWLAERMPAWVVPDTLTAIGSHWFFVDFYRLCFDLLSQGFSLAGHLLDSS